VFYSVCLHTRRVTFVASLGKLATTDVTLTITPLLPGDPNLPACQRGARARKFLSNDTAGITFKYLARRGSRVDIFEIVMTTRKGAPETGTFASESSFPNKL